MRLNFILLFLVVGLTANCQLLTWSPNFIQESSDPITITVDATKGNQGLKDYTPTTDVYVHIGVITTSSASSSDWKYAPFTWGTTDARAQAAYMGSNKWKYTITGGLRSFFGITNASEQILKIAILFRNGNGSKAQRNADGSDMYVPVYQPGLQVRLTNPTRDAKYNPSPDPNINITVGSSLPVTGISSQAADLKLYLNGTQISSATNTTTISTNAVIASAGNQVLVAQATSGTVTKNDTIQFTATNNTVVVALPAGLKDGINYEPGDTSVTLVLFAPNKSNVAVIGEFNNWSPTTPYQMNITPDGQRFWVRITGLTPGVEYAYQYFIDGSLKVADYMTEKILDPANDQYIPSTTYPNLKPYPAGATGIVSILQTAKPTYLWQATNFTRPDQRNLVIYELLVRDFVAAKNWQTVKDSITYLKHLGVNAIEVMPFNEFEGNSSWGYNPDFYFAPDKAYGTETALKQFIDECHRQGIAVIMDMVLNHSMGSSPMVQMYFDAANNIPAANNPWFNQYPTHDFNVGYQFNHESAATKDFTDKVVAHWLTNYHIDGYRFDLAKGFTQKRTCDATGGNCNDSAFAAYDQSRINIWDTIYTHQQQVSPGSYTILEMFADNSEETVYANSGMMIWGNLNYNFNQATMGYSDGWDFNWGVPKARNWSQPNLVTYQESHDEERLMYKNEQYGNSSGSYNVKDVNTGLKRNEMAAAFWAAIPGPKMLWQFEELGYDYSINTCQDGTTINNSCRTDPKPIRWDYLNNANRKSLHDVYAQLLQLRNVPNFLPTFTSNDVSWNLSGAFKSLQVNSDSLKITVIGNFDVVPATRTITFQNSGTWYNYLTGTTRTATGSPESITLQPGEYYFYTNRNAAPLVTALPLQLISFNGSHSGNNNVLNWVTANEVNVSTFSIERSLNGVDFSAIGNVAAKNISGTQQLQYSFTDYNASAARVYYRLKIIDIDGKFTYSSVVIINSGDALNIKLSPNPITAASKVEFNLNEASNVNVSVINGYGQTISTLFSGLKPRGQQTILLRQNNFNAAKLQAGVYFLKLIINGSVFTQEIVLQK